MVTNTSSTTHGMDGMLAPLPPPRLVEDHAASHRFHGTGLLSHGEHMDDGFRALFSEELLLIDARGDAELSGFLAFIRDAFPPRGRWQDGVICDADIHEVVLLAKAIALAFGGLLDSTSRRDMERRWDMRLHELHLKPSQDLRIGCLLGSRSQRGSGGAAVSPDKLGIGLMRHRAVLFKYACDRLRLCSCALIGGAVVGPTDDPWGAPSRGCPVVRDVLRNIIWAGGRPVVVDCCEDPGSLTLPEARDLHRLLGRGAMTLPRPPLEVPIGDIASSNNSKRFAGVEQPPVARLFPTASTEMGSTNIQLPSAARLSTSATTETGYAMPPLPPTATVPTQSNNDVGQPRLPPPLLSSSIFKSGAVDPSAPSPDLIPQKSLSASWFAPNPSSASSGKGTPLVSSRSASRSHEIEDAVKLLRFENSSGGTLNYVSHKALPTERRRIFAKRWPSCEEGSGQVVTIQASEGPLSSPREFVAVLPTSGKPELLEAQCQIVMEDLTPSECIEYTFAEAPETWTIADLSHDAAEAYKATKFEAWRKMLMEPTCEAQLRRMLQIGVVTKLYDDQVFPTPEAFKDKYQVTDEKSGKLIKLPHPVSRLRIWDTGTQQYKAIDTHLRGAPSETEKDAWWRKTLDTLKEQMGQDYIDGLITGQTQKTL